MGIREENVTSIALRHVLAALALVTALWALTILLVPPTGEFPLNDDWIYARAVSDWIDTGTYQGHPFSTANLVGQAWWGKLFCAGGGFSFTALRWSTLVLWLFASLATTLSALRLRARPFTAALAGALIIANPIAMNLGYTFMTDVPFMALMALAGLAYLCALDTPRWQWVLLGSLFGAAALLTRQFAILLPIAFVLSSCPWDTRWRRREMLPLLIALVAPWLAAWLLLQFLPSHAAELGHVWDPQVLGNSWGERFFGGLKFYSSSMVLLGCLVLPLAAAQGWHWLRHKEGRVSRRALALACALLFILLTACTGDSNRIPFIGNILYDTGTGPMTLRGILMGSYLWRPVSLGGWWWLPTLAGVLVAGWMVAGCLRWLLLIPGDGRRPLHDPRRRQQCFLMFWAMLMILALYHPWLPVRFDRYLIGALVPVVLLVAMAESGRSLAGRAVQVVTLVALFAFSVLGVQDYFAWNTTRWAMLNKLMNEQGLKPQEIDGGYEFNGWYTSQDYIKESGARAFLRSGPLGWWVVDDRYAISWLPRPGFAKVEEVPYGSWLAGDMGKLLLLKKKDEGVAP